MITRTKNNGWTGAFNRLRGACQKMEEEAFVRARRADRILHRRPYPVLGVAFAAGLAIGLLLPSD